MLLSIETKLLSLISDLVLFPENLPIYAACLSLFLLLAFEEKGLSSRETGVFTLPSLNSTEEKH